MGDTKWPRAQAWPASRAFDRKSALAALAAVTTESVETITNYDPDTKKTEKSQETHYTPAPVWSAIVTEPNLGPDEGWFYYAILWKEPSDTVDAATSKRPKKLLDRARSDLREHATQPWFDARAYWCSVAGMLSRDDLARFVGDARIFAHSYKEGGTSIITSHSERVSFVEAFYQTIVPYFGEAEWDIVAKELPAIDEALLSTKSSKLATQILRLAAASGRHDAAIVNLLDAAAAADVSVFPVLHALHDPAHLAKHAPRLGLKLWDPIPLEKWLDRFGDTQMAYVETCIAEAPTKKVKAPLEATLKKFRTPAKKQAKAK